LDILPNRLFYFNQTASAIPGRFKRTDLHKIAEMPVFDPTARANPRRYAIEGALEILQAAI